MTGDDSNGDNRDDGDDEEDGGGAGDKCGGVGKMMAVATHGDGDEASDESMACTP